MYGELVIERKFKLRLRNVKIKLKENACTLLKTISARI